ncbi:hypothetical protein PR048_004435 [Dryococelus australis]|uniref:Uncharacterized protein n=1 Tax=Dryococelus australis TaxID=614101 RepID=A0ABQ9I6F7_9NEOP|nr:hypothetical protein PR048_004435 [Dryococelus australis]
MWAFIACNNPRDDGNAARLARRSDEALGVRVSVARVVGFLEVLPLLSALALRRFIVVPYGLFHPFEDYPPPITTSSIQGPSFRPERAALVCKGGGKREYPEKTRQLASSSSTIPTCENPGASPPATEPGSPWWKASALVNAPPLPHLTR